MTEPPEPQRTEILMKLIALVKPTGGAVWCNGRLPSLRYLPYGELEMISWWDAAVLAGVELATDGYRRSKVRKLVRERLDRVSKPMGRAITEVSDADLDRRALAMGMGTAVGLIEAEARRRKA